MALWVDKYRPKTLDELDYHKEQAENLKLLAASDDFPHLLVYGPSGAGKKTRIMCVLRQLYPNWKGDLRIDQRSFKAPSGKEVQISSVSSNFHVEINPGEVGIYDRVVVQELVKSMAQTQQLDATSQRQFKVVVLSEVDRLSRDAQQALRRTMEKYAAVCRLILCCTSISKVMAPVRSRCLAIRVAAPSDEQMAFVLRRVCEAERVPLPPPLAERIVEKANGSLRRALLSVEACHVQQSPMTATQPVTDLDWEIYLRETSQIIFQNQTPESLLKVRERLYEMISRCIPPSLIFKRLLLLLINGCDASLKPAVTAAAADFEHRMQLGTKAIYHLEAFIAKFMTIYKQFIESFADF